VTLLGCEGKSCGLPKAAAHTWQHQPRSGTFLPVAIDDGGMCRGGGGGRKTCAGACVCNLLEHIHSHEQRDGLARVHDHLRPHTIRLAEGEAAAQQLGRVHVTVNDVAEISRWSLKREEGHTRPHASQWRTCTFRPATLRQWPTAHDKQSTSHCVSDACANAWARNQRQGLSTCSATFPANSSTPRSLPSRYMAADRNTGRA